MPTSSTLPVLAPSAPTVWKRVAVLRGRFRLAAFLNEIRGQLPDQAWLVSPPRPTLSGGWGMPRLSKPWVGELDDGAPDPLYI